nr:Putative DNA-binding protein in cluster with Type I restriction-modification system [Kibdelosporangium sp. MJ126-NF4]CTQ91146.1 Putative DNA-binding protein in cluster with Type I restriction-modification system [Kibdelosporangium sp. MJ126-NF4]
MRQLANDLGVGHSTLSKWERGELLPKTEDVASILAKLGITGDERDRLLEMARHAHDPQWMAVGVPGIKQQLSALMEFEKEATEIVNCSPLLIPGPLQIGDYIRGIMGKRPQADTRVAMRLGRSDILTRRNPVRFTALIGEAALTYQIGDADIMAAQLRHLLTMSERSNITIQVMPTNAGYHPGMLGPFIALHFKKLRPIVHLEHFGASGFVYDDDDVHDFVEAAAHIATEIAMSPADSAGLIADVAHHTEVK